MAEFRDYKRYVTDPDWAKTYSDYQKKYIDTPRESDRKSARLVVNALRMMSLRGAPRVLDIGCSTGNFLRHLKNFLPAAELTGGDLMVPVIDECRSDPSLAGMAFEVMDVFKIPPEPQYDAIVANAVNVYFEQDEYVRALRSIRAALRPGGSFVAYEWVFPAGADQRIIEKSIGHPEGLKFWFRSEAFIKSAFAEAGFSEVEVTPFEIPIDLPKPVPNGTDADFMTYTVIEELTGRRLMFRGSRYQPWAHLVAS